MSLATEEIKNGHVEINGRHSGNGSGNLFVDRYIADLIVEGETQETINRRVGRLVKAFNIKVNGDFHLNGNGTKPEAITDERTKRNYREEGLWRKTAKLAGRIESISIAMQNTKRPMVGASGNIDAVTFMKSLCSMMESEVQKIRKVLDGIDGETLNND